MCHSTLVRATCAGFLGLGLGAPRAFALVSLNDGRDKVFVNGSVTFGWDSNIYANRQASSDFVMTASAGADYIRRAGLIGVDASVNVNAARYNKFSTEDFKNPRLNLEFTKQTGRTTGSLAFSAARDSRADPDVNLRTHSWNYTAGLNLNYPVIDRYFLTGGLVLSRLDYQNEAFLTDLDSISANIDLFYIYTSERDLFLGYRFRHGMISTSSYDIDHGFSLGLKGRILPKLNGSLRLGVQRRYSYGVVDEVFDSWTAAFTATWNLSRRTSLTGTLSKDFNIASTGVSTDALKANLDLSYALDAKWFFGAGVGVGMTEFLGIEGEGREDFFFTYNVSANYSMNDHFKASASYNYYINWSTLPFADFERDGYSLTLSTRW